MDEDDDLGDVGDLKCPQCLVPMGSTTDVGRAPSAGLPSLADPSRL